LERDRHQLWAEALHLFQSGHPWWLQEQELIDAATDEQEDRFEVDPWQDCIRDWVNDPSQRLDREGGPISKPEFVSTPEMVTMTDILIHAIGKDLERCGRADETRVGQIMSRIGGWERKRLGPRNGRRYFYVRTTPWPTAS